MSQDLPKPRSLPSLTTPIMGYPLFAWVCAAIYLFIFFNLFSSYL